MSIYKFTFNVAGDFIAEPWSITKTVVADSLDVAVQEVWDGYQSSINRIIKFPHEAMVIFEPNINPLFSLTGSCDDIPLNEDIMLYAFYQERIRKYMTERPHWN